MPPNETNPSPSKTTWFGVFRAALLPFLVILLLASVYGIVVSVMGWQEVEARPPEGHAAGFVGMGIMLLGATSILVALVSSLTLWFLWRPSKRRLPEGDRFL